MSSSCPCPFGCPDQLDNSSSIESAKRSALSSWLDSRNPLKRSIPNSWPEGLPCFHHSVREEDGFVAQFHSYLGNGVGCVGE